jgi:hypothetical protein
MLRPAGNSYFVLVVLLTLPFTRLAAITTAASQTPPPGGVSHQAFGGIWVLNRDLGDQPGAQSTATEPDTSRQGRRGGGGFGGRVGGRGRGGGRGYGGQPAQAEDDGRQQAVLNYVRTQITDVPKQLTIVVHDTSLSLTDADGAVISLPTDGKKVDERAQNGLVRLSRRNRWDANTLVCEIEIDNGPKITRNYELSPGGTQLTITTTVDRGGRPVKITHIYERPVESR